MIAKQIARGPARRATRNRPYWLARARQLAPIAVLAVLLLIAAAALVLFIGPPMTQVGAR